MIYVHCVYCFRHIQFHHISALMFYRGLSQNPFHLFLCHIKACVRIIIKCHCNVWMPHNILQCFGVHSCISHVGTKCMSQSMWSYWRNRYIVFSVNSAKHSINTCHGFGVLVFIKKQKIFISLYFCMITI